ncbi:uncharacterized protein LOC128745935 [Sabethes cyaneus]|uniref:uncharacterized protein LOC128745935 n=1 Tax=Sabethes cyaneus TaxID=53552 RepID=UPI00237DB2C0|nr:uncharacterized protein LOC128745935 [Sabethes cyaneus]
MATARTPDVKKNKEQKSGGDIPGETEATALPISEQLKVKKDKESKKKMDNEFKVLSMKKETVERKLRRVQNAIWKQEEIQNKHFLQLQMKLADSAYGEYNELQNEMFNLNIGDEVRYAEELKLIEFEALYSDIFVKITSLIETTANNELVSAVSMQQLNNQIMIPPLKAPLPTFDGNYENWYAFKNMFENVMSRYQTESPAIKLYHLRNALVGAAVGVIDQDIINNGDYDAAWATLRERYEDKRVIIDKHIDAIFNIPVMTKDSGIGLRKLIDTCSKHVDTLKNLELPVVGLGEMMLLNVLAKKLDLETRKAWELSQGDELPEYRSTMEFLKERCRVYEKKSRTTKPSLELNKQSRPSSKVDVRMHSLVTTNEKCQHCKGDHELWKCDIFKKAAVSDKYSTLRKSGSCFNCLERGHITGKCRSEHSCKRCGRRHHTYLHSENAQSSESKASVANTIPNEASSDAVVADTSSSAPTSGSVLCANVDVEQNTLLATVVASICGSSKRKSVCRAVLDSASHKNFITEELASKLGLKQKRSNYTIAGIGGNSIGIQFKVHARIRSRVSDYESPCMEFLVVKKITGDLPVQKFTVEHLSIPEEIVLADPTFNVPGPVDVLLGSGLFFKLMKQGQLNLADDMPTVQETHLGWIISGFIPIVHVNMGHAFYTTVDEDDVGKLLERFWYLDSYEGTEELERSSDNECVTHFLETHQRKGDGRFVVRLPFNEKQRLLGDSLAMAKRRFLAVERRLDRDPTLKMQYVSFMREYESLKHMVNILPSSDEEIGNAFYLPHHYVLKPTSTTTKLRVVFDGSAESTSGVSVNDVQMVGPTVQNDLISILINFRSFRIAVSADIPKMYRQVEVHDDDVRFQRIVWREDNSQPLKFYALKTVTYGLASSPFLATMSLRQLASENEERYPLAAQAIKNSFYIDDFLAGANSLEDALELIEQVTALLKEGSFDVHKVCSNSTAVLQTIPDAKREKLGEVGNPEMSTAARNSDKQDNCAACNNPDTDNNYVQCDACNSWCHFSCVNVSDSVRDRAWMCSNCMETAPQNPPEPRCSSSSSSDASMQRSLAQLKKRQDLERQRMEHELQVKFLNEQLALLDSTRSRVSNRESGRLVADWVNGNPEQEDRAGGWSLEPASSRSARGSKLRRSSGNGTQPGKATSKLPVAVGFC